MRNKDVHAVVFLYPGGSCIILYLTKLYFTSFYLFIVLYCTVPHSTSCIVVYLTLPHYTSCIFRYLTMYLTISLVLYCSQLYLPVPLVLFCTSPYFSVHLVMFCFPLILQPVSPTEVHVTEHCTPH